MGSLPTKKRVCRRHPAPATSTAGHPANLQPQQPLPDPTEDERAALGCGTGGHPTAAGSPPVSTPSSRRGRRKLEARPERDSGLSQKLLGWKGPYSSSPSTPSSRLPASPRGPAVGLRPRPGGGSPRPTRPRDQAPRPGRRARGPGEAPRRIGGGRARRGGGRRRRTAAPGPGRALTCHGLPPPGAVEPARRDLVVGHGGARAATGTGDGEQGGGGGGQGRAGGGCGPRPLGAQRRPRPLARGAFIQSRPRLGSAAASASGGGGAGGGGAGPGGTGPGGADPRVPRRGAARSPLGPAGRPEGWPGSVCPRK